MTGAAAGSTRPCAPARLKTRADFLRAAGGWRVHSRSISLEAVRRGDTDRDPCRIGLTVTRKVGGAVERNRIKRRLREALRADLPLEAGHDLVVVARRAALSTPFPDLVAELRRCLDDHKSGRSRKSGPRRKSRSPKNGYPAPQASKTQLAQARDPASCDIRPDLSQRDAP